VHFSGNHLKEEVASQVRQMLAVTKVQKGINSKQGLFTKQKEEGEDTTAHKGAQFKN
jgi:hypothetical protein